ncbi:MAG: SDR family oxidoreductase [Planctomycetota bacterium]
MHIDLKNKNALVCGSTQGIGLATAQLLSQAGATITLVARNEERLKTALTKLDTDYNQSHDFICADFSNPEDLNQKVKARLQAGAEFQILINNTGGPPGGEILTATLEQFEIAYTQHLKCNHLLVQSLVPGMIQSGYGRIVNVISTSVKQPIPGLGVSNTTRGAVASWAKTMANELGEHGITVNNVLPGATETERLNSIIASKAEKTGKPIHEVSKQMEATIPMQRFGSPSEIASVILFLSSQLGSYVTGVNLPVDGGRTSAM